MEEKEVPGCEVLEQLVKICRMVSEAACGWQVRQAGERASPQWCLLVGLDIQEAM